MRPSRSNPYVIGRLARSAGIRRALAPFLAMALAGSLLSATPASADPKPEHLKGQRDKLDKDGGEVAGKGWATKPGKQITLPAPVWPAAGTAVRATAATTAAKRSLAAEKAADQQVSAAVVDRAALPQRWRAGVVARVSATTATKASITMDYRKFRHAYGADWASRLRLWSLPDCALTTPEKAGCSASLLPSRNDPASGSVSGEVSVPAAKTATAAALATTSASAPVPASATTMVALAAGPSGPSGDFSATGLSASATWSAGGSTGDFTWTYPMRAPNGINGPQPGMSLSYSSSSVDGRSSASNNQPSVIGEGFDFSPGSIERRYVSCDDDKSGSPNNPAHSFDQCWRSHNAVMSLGGSSTELVYEKGKGWHGRSENASKIELLTDADNGDDNGEHWKVTTNDGMQYFFGLNKLPGQSAATNSAWTAPVYGNHDDEPCHATKFADSDCNQAWRWNLDYVVDTHGNTLSYWYTKETNRYASEGSSSKLVSYVRGGTLDRIDYGTWDRGTADRSVTALAQVNLTYADRCLSDCSTHSGDKWPDTPWDQECKTGATTCDDYSPTFWTTKRLAKVATRVWDTTRSPAGWQDVDAWQLTHSFPSPGDGQKAGLWLSSIVHTGLVGGTIAMPPVTFDPVAMPNRVLTATNTTNNWQRIANIHSETGSMLQVSYSLPECTAQNLPAAPENNTKRCYPVKGPDPLSTSGGDITEWWHKYVVTQIAETDVQLADGHQAPTKNTYYTYVGTPAWHYADDDVLSKPKYKTWDQFRGYETVRTQVGDTSKTLTETKFLRGMHGDRLEPKGGTRSVTVPASVGGETVYDEDQFAGMVREQTVYNGTTDKPVSRTVNVPWRSGPTASRTINGDTVTARFVNTGKTYTSQALGVNGTDGWRTTSTQTSFDDYGMPSSVQDNGDIAKNGDEKCTTTTYNRNTGKNLISLPGRVTTTLLTCGVAPTSADQVVDDALTFYDGATSASTAPAKGDLTRTDLLKGWTAAGGTTWLTSGKSTFDDFGRQYIVTDVRGNTLTDTYTPAKGLPTQKKQTTNLGWTTTTDLQPAWTAPTKITDMNGRVTDVTYDALGRTSQVWDPGWTMKDNPKQPLTKFTYVYSANRTSYPYVKTESLNSGGGTDVTYDIYDGLLRPRQTQKAGVGGGRVVSDTLYDSWGRASLSYPAHIEPDNPAGTLWWEPEWSVPAQNRTIYDQADRPTDSLFLAGDGVTNVVEKWRTTTTYEGDRITVVPPKGGTATTTVTDIRGRTAELREYKTTSGAAGAYNATKYGYNDRGDLTSAVDSAGNTWTYKYDQLGRKIESNDPDSGTSTSSYNDFGDLMSTTDARKNVLVYSYDSLGRRTGIYDNSVAEANQRAGWTYDKLFSGSTVRGQLTEAVRYDIAADGTRQPYKWQARNFNARMQVGGENYVIPAAETGLGGTYVFGHSYAATTGTPTSQSYPSGGGLFAEAVTTTYDQVSGLPKFLDTNDDTYGSYVVGQQYTGYGEPTVTTSKIAGGVYVEQGFSYELDTRRVHQVTVKPETAKGTVAQRTYAYDAVGKLTSIADAPQVGQADTQCFTYDYLRRLTSAWTPAGGADACSAAPSTGKLGGPAPYWTDWTIDDLGNRTKEVSHTAGGDTTRTYAVPAPGKGVVRPHAVTGLTTTQPDQSSTTVGYTYDDSGNTITRPGDTGTQALTWDAEGRAVKAVEGGKVTTSLYDASGTRLIRRDSEGSTLYLPGQEIRRKVSGTTATLEGTRYYAFGGQTVASRTTDVQSLTWLFSDHQGTQQIAVNAYTQKVDIRRQTPYGDTRGPVTAWPNGKGFVGGDIDPTGLTHVGAREYDTELGRFISVDPIQDLSDPLQWNAYSYSGNDPINRSDPSGLRDDTLFYGPVGAKKMDDNSAKAKPQKDRHDNDEGNRKAAASNSGGSQPAAKPKKRSWWQTATDWVSENQNMLVGAAVGVVAFAGCTALTGGSGVLLCAGAAGVAANLTTDYLDGDLNSAQDVADSIVEGAVSGWLAVPTAVVDFAVQGSAAIDSAASGDYSGAAKHGALAGLDAVVVAGGAGAARAGKGLGGGKSLGKCMNSFTAATLVLMANGTRKPIGDIKVGDKVLATDPEAGTTTDEAVEVLHDNVDHDLVNLKVKLADGSTKVIRTTAHHPFWDRTTRTWTDAQDLKRGHRLQTAGGGTATVKHVRTFTATRHMLNLTVANIHTYYVLAGTTPVLVHNCGGAAAGWASKADFSDMKTMSKKFDAHAADFGITGNRNKANLGAYEAAMRDHMTAPGTKIYRFDYRGQGPAVGFIDPSTNRMVMLHGDSGKFWSGWRLGDNQFASIVDRGFLK